jgi:putative ABC transport system permease protein
MQVLTRRKLRTALTALAVAWGIFMLVVLLAAGRAIANGAETEFSRDAANSVYVHPGATAEPFRGKPKGQKVRLDAQDFASLGDVGPAVARRSARFYPQATLIASFGSREGVFPVRAVHADHDVIERTNVVTGRFVNERDVAERRKVAVIGKKVAEGLFPRGVDPIGKLVRFAPVAATSSRASSGAGGAGGSGAGGAGGTTATAAAPAVRPEPSRGSEYLVVGVFEEENEEREQQTIYVPISTAQLIYGGGRHIDELAFTVDASDAAASTTVVDDVRAILAARHGFAPGDKRALRIWNNREMQERILALFRGIQTFIWIIGLGTIAAGVVGVGNIMLISVQERTREIGVRKAIGATPASIVRMVIEEALAITMVSGYVGLVAGVAAVELAQRLVPPSEFFKRPEIDLGVGLAATGVLVVAGMLAGAFPAKRAAQVNPITALRAE